MRRLLGVETKSVSAHPVPRSAIASVKLGTSVELVCCVGVGVKIKMVCACEAPKKKSVYIRLCFVDHKQNWSMVKGCVLCDPVKCENCKVHSSKEDEDTGRRALLMGRVWWRRGG